MPNHQISVRHQPLMLPRSWVGRDANGQFVQAGALGEDKFIDDDSIVEIVCGSEFYKTLLQYIKDKKRHN
jgi:hypothetical protein